MTEESAPIEQENDQTDQVEQSPPEKREDRRAQNDLLRFKHESKALAEKNAQLMRELESFKEQSLVEKQNYKQLYENEKTKTEMLATEKQKIQSTFFGSLKNQEIQKEAMKLGIRDEALSDLGLLDSSTVITETTSTGNVNILGASEFVEQLKQTRPHWFRQQGAPVINNGNPSFTKKEYTASEMLALEKTDPAKYREELMKRIRK